MTTQILQWLDSVDVGILLWVNHLGTPALDPIVWFISNVWFWIPVLVYLAWRVFQHFSFTWNRLVAIAAISLCFGGSDLIVGKFIKPEVARLRPTHRPDLAPKIRTLPESSGQPYLGGPLGFVSNHAANSFGLATLFILLIGQWRREAWLFAWAALLSLTRLYLGVHYPTDLLGGVVVGVAWAMVIWWGLRRIGFPRPEPAAQ